jgi:hypothetical protein
LAFEYQGETHYFDVPIYGPLQHRQKKDSEKAAVAKEEGITLITIPFWWDKMEASLVATIKQQRTDLTLPYYISGTILICRLYTQIKYIDLVDYIGCSVVSEEPKETFGSTEHPI